MQKTSDPLETAGAQFRTTAWSIVQAAGDPAAPDAGAELGMAVADADGESLELDDLHRISGSLFGTVEDLPEKGAGPLLRRLAEHLLGRALFDDAAVVHEDHAIGDVAREADLGNPHGISEILTASLLPSLLLWQSHIGQILAEFRCRNVEPRRKSDRHRGFPSHTRPSVVRKFHHES